MTTQIIDAQQGLITSEMETVANYECVTPELIRQGVSEGKIVILGNKQKKGVSPVAVGEGLGVKVNVNVSDKLSSLEETVDKVKIIKLSGADIITELSLNTNLDERREKFISVASMPYGTIPIYQSVLETTDKYKNISKLSKKKIFSDIEKHCEQGVDFILVHAGLTKEVIQTLEEQKRLSGIVSKGGSMLACWIKATEKENPLYENFDELLDIARTYDVTLLLASSLGAGSILDIADRAQIKEAFIFGELVRKARESGVQTMVEGLGHCSTNKIQSVVEITKKLTDFAPLFIQNSPPADAFGDYNIISNSIGATIAASYGVDLISSVELLETPSYFNAKLLKESVIAAKIAAHSADVAKNNKKALEIDRQMSSCAKNKNDNSVKDDLSSKNMFEIIAESIPYVPCSVCGKYCSPKRLKDTFKY